LHPHAFAVVVGGLAAIIFFYVSSENQREAKSHTLIMPSQLDLNDVTLSGGYPYVWDIKGTIENNSAYTLTGLTLKVTVQDCASTCIVVGEETVNAWVTVPPSQLRAFDGIASFANMPKPKKLTWNCQVVSTTGRIAGN
jgi:hypothetical protein